MHSIADIKYFLIDFTGQNVHFFSVILEVEEQ